jgi:hypothetical protein
VNDWMAWEKMRGVMGKLVDGWLLRWRGVIPMDSMTDSREEVWG